MSSNWSQYPIRSDTRCRWSWWSCCRFLDHDRTCLRTRLVSDKHIRSRGHTPDHRNTRSSAINTLRDHGKRRHHIRNLVEGQCSFEQGPGVVDIVHLVDKSRRDRYTHGRIHQEVAPDRIHLLDIVSVDNTGWSTCHNGLPDPIRDCHN